MTEMTEVHVAGDVHVPVVSFSEIIFVPATVSD